MASGPAPRASRVWCGVARVHAPLWKHTSLQPRAGARLYDHAIVLYDDESERTLQQLEVTRFMRDLDLRKSRGEGGRDGRIIELTEEFRRGAANESQRTNAGGRAAFMIARDWYSASRKAVA